MHEFSIDYLYSLRLCFYFCFGFRLRAQYGHDIKANALHGSSTAEHAMESMKLVFGDSLEFNPDGTVKGRGVSVL